MRKVTLLPLVSRRWGSTVASIRKNALQQTQGKLVKRFPWMNCSNKKYNRQYRSKCNLKPQKLKNMSFTCTMFVRKNRCCESIKQNYQAEINTNRSCKQLWRGMNNGKKKLNLWILLFSSTVWRGEEGCCFTWVCFNIVSLSEEITNPMWQRSEFRSGKKQAGQNPSSWLFVVQLETTPKAWFGGFQTPTEQVALFFF